MTYDRGTPNGNASPTAQKAVVYSILCTRLQFIALEQSRSAQLCANLRNLCPPTQLGSADLGRRKGRSKDREIVEEMLVCKSLPGRSKN